MFYELRHYQTRPGKRDEWVRYMEEIIIPFQVSKGMVIAGSFVDEENEDSYFWIRRFEGEDQRKELYSAVYDSDQWKNEIAPPVGELLVRDAAVITRIVPTSMSVLH
jgi:NIPSNAP